MSKQHTSVVTKAAGYQFVTVSSGFRDIESEGKFLMQVENDLPLNLAVKELNCLLESLRELALDGVFSAGVSERKAWLMGFCLDAAGGLGAAIEKSLMKAGRD